MIPRKPLVPNNRSVGKLMSELEHTVNRYVTYPKKGPRQSIFTYARVGRQNSQGFGGGNRVGKPPIQ